MLEDDIDATAPGEPAHLLWPIRVGMVDREIGTELAGALKFCRAARARNDNCAAELGDLQAYDADAATGSDNEHGFAGSQIGPADEHVPCRRACDGDRRRRIECKFVWNGEEMPGWRCGVFGIAAPGLHAVDATGEAHVVFPGTAERAVSAADCRIDQHTVADPPAVHALAQHRNLAGGLGAGNVRQSNRSRRLAEAAKDIDAVDTAGAHADQNLAWTRFGCGDLLDLECVEAAMTAKQRR